MTKSRNPPLGQSERDREESAILGEKKGNAGHWHFFLFLFRSLFSSIDLIAYTADDCLDPSLFLAPLSPVLSLCPALQRCRPPEILLRRGRPAVRRRPSPWMSQAMTCHLRLPLLALTPVAGITLPLSWYSPRAMTNTMPAVSLSTRYGFIQLHPMTANGSQ